jgi:hypothetical protein
MPEKIHLKKDSFWFMVSDVSVYSLLALLFLGHGQADNHGGYHGIEKKAAHFMLARKQNGREIEGIKEKNIPFKSDTNKLQLQLGPLLTS